jgi:hypothetical protein
MAHQDIYTGKSNGQFISPFSFKVDLMRQLVLIPFEKDPDIFYNQFEVQLSVLSDGTYKIAVIAYKLNGSADVYHQQGYPLAFQSSILNAPAFIETIFDSCFFTFSPADLDLSISFRDVHNRAVILKIAERERKDKVPFTLLAPVGVISKKPLSMPVYYMYLMSFARKNHCDIIISVGGKFHKPDVFFLPVDKSSNYFTRYSLDTFNVDINPAHNGFLEIKEKGNKNSFNIESVHYELKRNNGHPEIKKIFVQRDRHLCTVEFSPSFPDISALKNNIFLTGDFSIASDMEAGFIKGTYQIGNKKNDINIKLHPELGWIPRERRLILKLMFKLVKIFRDWPKSYIWDAQITRNENGCYFIDSTWKRIM